MVRHLVRGPGGVLVPAALACALLTGCSSETGVTSRTPSEATAKTVSKPSAEPAGGTRPLAAAKKAGTVGGPESACPLPVSFDLAASWKPAAVKNGPPQGPVTLTCEIDAKPAGNIGFLRVWTGAERSFDPRKALEAFVAAEAPSRDKETYAESKAGDLPATEVSYLNTSDMLDAPKTERAIVFKAGAGVVVIHLGGLDTEEYEQMLPAYELAKNSVHAL